MFDKNEVKKKLQNRFSKTANYNQIIKNIVVRSFKLNRIVITVSSILLVSMFSVCVVYAQEIKEIIKSIVYKYEPKGEWKNKYGYGVDEDSTGVYSISINGIVKIKDGANLHKPIKSIIDVEKNLGIKFLKNNKIQYSYFDFYTIDSIRNQTYRGEFIENPAIIRIKASNFVNYECDNFVFSIASKNPQGLETHEQCKKEMYKNQPDKILDLQMVFVTQFATQTQLKNLIFYMANFPNEEVEIYHSKILYCDIFINRWNTYLFVIDNIAYLFDTDSNGYTKEEMIEIIESMKY